MNIELEIYRLGQQMTKAIKAGDMKRYRALEARQNVLQARLDEIRRGESPENHKRRY